MRTIIERMLLEPPKKGLLLLSPPTGFGKTYSILEGLAENIEEIVKSGLKIFFLTNLKKNLPMGDLGERFAAKGKQEVFERYVLFVDSNSETLCQNLLHVESDIPDRFKQGNYSRLKSYVRSLMKGVRLDKTVREIMKAEVRKELEPAFRKSIQVALKNAFSRKTDRLAAVRDDPAWQWVGKLYPSVFFEEKQIFFMSVDKFIKKNTPIVEPSYYFEERLEDSLVFIDEFDAAKDVMLNAIIQDGVRHKIDLLNLFLKVHRHLQQNECPESLLQESRHRQKLAAEKKWADLRVIFDKVHGKANALFEEFDLQHTCKSHPDFATSGRNFLFYDYQYHHVLDARNKRIEVVQDTENRTNWIMARGRKDAGGGKNIRTLFSQLAGFMVYFQQAVGYIAENYRYKKQEEHEHGESFSLETAIATVLNHFLLGREEIRFLTGNIMERRLPYGVRFRASNIQSQNFYETGFRYHDVLDRDEHDTLSKLYLYDFSKTPESFLLRVASQCMVVGVSATANLETNIGNFDLGFLKDKLGESFCLPGPEEMDRLEKAYAAATRGYSQIDVRAEFIGPETDDQAEEQLAALVGDREAAEGLHRSLELVFSQKKTRFLLSRYVRVLAAWRYFLENPDIQGMLCLFSKIPREGDGEFNLNMIREYAQYVAVDMGLDVEDGTLSDVVVVLSGEEFDKTKQNVTKNLGAGDRQFIISAYQTVGAGQNLQHPLPEGVEPVQINDFPSRNEIDLNALYLDRPTNLLVNILGGELKEESFIKHIFQLEFLQEEGAVSPKVFRGKINQAFHKYVGQNGPVRSGPESYVNLYETEAYTRFMVKVVLQAVGRICRTNLKLPSIHVLADTYLKKHIGRCTLPDTVIPVREYEALRQTAGAVDDTKDIQKEFENRASYRSERTMAFINRQLRTQWTDTRMKDWEALRNHVLEQPFVFSREEAADPWGPALYVEMPNPAQGYWYEQQNDFSKVEVFFSSGKGKRAVNAASARLPELMAVPGVKELFVENGWATTFPDCGLLLTPPMFNNIYKGALGEVVGRYVFKDRLGIDLFPLPVKDYERFDFKIFDDIYVDFKLWRDHVAVEGVKAREKILKKMEECGARKVFIVNILAGAQERFQAHTSHSDRIIEVPFLCGNGEFSSEALGFLAKEVAECAC